MGKRENGSAAGVLLGVCLVVFFFFFIGHGRRVSHVVEISAVYKVGPALEINLELLFNLVSFWGSPFHLGEHPRGNSERPLRGSHLDVEI